MYVNLILASQFLPQVIEVFGTAEESLQLGRFLKSNLVAFGHHSQEGINGLGNLVFWAGDRNNVAGLLSIWKVDLAVPLLL